MEKYSLDGIWELSLLGEPVLGLTGDPIEASVPGTVCGAYLEKGLIPDPFYRENELTLMPLWEKDFQYEKRFAVEEAQLQHDRLLLVFEGIDTLGDIYLNDRLLKKTDNMHLRHELDVTELVQAGENSLRVVLHSPVRYIRGENEKIFTGGSLEAMAGYPHLRKAHCMFGWDWGIRLPDSGIFRSVYLLGMDLARINEVYVEQEHRLNRSKAESVLLRFRTACEELKKDACRLEITVTAPDGQILTQQEDGSILVTDPKLWWPNGYGDQPLYTVCAKLTAKEDGRLLDIWERRIGLRTVTVNTEPDEWGRKFAHRVNGLDIFAMGADYIPEDNLLGRINKERTRRLLTDCVDAHHNCIRIWGGGYYPDDYFYDICDELGLLVWQDFMFACSSYELDDAFDKNIREEITRIALAQPRHVVVPYPNLPKRVYPMNVVNEVSQQ